LLREKKLEPGGVETGTKGPLKKKEEEKTGKKRWGGRRYSGFKKTLTKKKWDTLIPGVPTSFAGCGATITA